jgi:RNA polymerase-binding protein DksA
MTKAGAKAAESHAAVRTHLTARRDQLLAEWRSHMQAARSEAQPEPGGDDTVLAEMRELDLSEADRDAREIDAINTALLRIDRGEYGQCVECGAAVGAERLAIAPHAARCIACETRREHDAGGVRSARL